MKSIVLSCFVMLVIISETFGVKYGRYGRYDGYELLDSHSIDSYGKGYAGPGDYHFGGYGKGYGGLGGYGSRRHSSYGRGVNKAASRLLAKLILKSLADKDYGSYGGYGGYGGYGSHGGYGGHDSYDGYKK